MLPKGYRPRGQAACGRARCAAFSCCSPPATFRSPPEPPKGVKDLSIQLLVLQLSVKALTVAVLPRTSWLDIQRAPTFASHSLNSFATNSGPLTERMFSAIPRNSITSARASISSYLPNLLATRMARFYRVYSSIIVNIRSVLPSCVIHALPVA